MQTFQSDNCLEFWRILLYVCMWTPHVEEQKPLIFSQVKRYISILKELNVKHETFPRLFSSLDQDENIIKILVKLMTTCI